MRRQSQPSIINISVKDKSTSLSDILDYESDFPVIYPRKKWSSRRSSSIKFVRKCRECAEKAVQTDSSFFVESELNSNTESYFDDSMFLNK